MKLIKTATAHREAMKRLETLMLANPAKGTAESEELELLAFLIETYEKAKFPVKLPSPVEAILFRMEQQGLSREDLGQYLGGKSKVSEVLAGKRPLSLPMVRKLHAGLGIPAEVLLQETPDASRKPKSLHRFSESI